MITEEEIEKYYKENYEKKNHKRGRNIHIPERLFRDFHKTCIDEGTSMSKKIRIFMIRVVMEKI